MPLPLQEYFLSQHQKVSRQQQERQAQQQERVQAKLQQRQEAFKAPEVSERPTVDALLRLPCCSRLKTALCRGQDARGYSADACVSVMTLGKTSEESTWQLVV